MDKENVAHIHSRILFSHKKNEIVPFAATWMDPEILILSEKSDKELSYETTYMLNLIKMI